MLVILQIRFNSEYRSKYSDKITFEITLLKFTQRSYVILVIFKWDIPNHIYIIFKQRGYKFKTT